MCRLTTLKFRWTLSFFSICNFLQIPGHGLPLRGFEITIIGHATLRKTLLFED